MEIERRQNIKRGSTFVNESTFQTEFFLHLFKNVNDNLNTYNFRQQGANIFEWTY